MGSPIAPECLTGSLNHSLQNFQKYFFTTPGESTAPHVTQNKHHTKITAPHVERSPSTLIAPKEWHHVHIHRTKGMDTTLIPTKQTPTYTHDPAKQQHRSPEKAHQNSMLTAQNQRQHPPKICHHTAQNPPETTQISQNCSKSQHRTY
jgi:hypothetical protein